MKKVTLISIITLIGFACSPETEVNELDDQVSLRQTASMVPSACCDPLIELTIYNPSSNPEYGYYLPNIITPEGDGENDTFQMLNVAKDFTYEMQVYSLDGRMVFEGTDLANGNGPFAGLDMKGNALPDGKYTYRITSRDFDAEGSVCVATSSETICLGDCRFIDMLDSIRQNAEACD